jgi:hypothetical protein
MSVEQECATVQFCANLESEDYIEFLALLASPYLTLRRT